MKVRVLLFAAFADAAGWSERELELPEGATAGDAWSSVRAGSTGLERWPAPPLLARNRAYAKTTTILAAGDELAFLPPIAGG